MPGAPWLVGQDKATCALLAEEPKLKKRLRDVTRPL